MTKRFFPIVIAMTFLTAMFSSVVRAADFNVLLGTWDLTVKATIAGESYEGHPLWRFTEASANAAIGVSSFSPDGSLLATWSNSKGQYRITHVGSSSDSAYYVSIIGNSMIGTIEGSYINNGTVGGTKICTICPPKVDMTYATSVTSSSANLNGYIKVYGLNTNCYFEYGTSTSYGWKTSTIIAEVSSSILGFGVFIDADIYGLSPNTTYHYRLVASNRDGSGYGTDKTFETTTTTIPTRPTVTTGSATLITSNSAILNGEVNPDGSSTEAYFEYGTTTSYGSATASEDIGPGSSSVTVSATISDLISETTYHYRLTAINSAGTSYGSDLTFTTSTTDFSAVYFPHIASDIGDWETEICVINTSDCQAISGVFKAYNDSGTHVSEDIAVTLAPYGRREITVGDEFTSPADIGYIVFESDYGAVAGYTKFYIEGHYRVAIPAVSDSEINTNDIYISHIASDENWGTGVSLLNTTSSPKTLTIEFDDGQTKTVSLTGNEHKVFTIKGLFDGQSQPEIQSGVIKDATGVIGLELFVNNPLNWMSGILLKDDTTISIYYPHTAIENGWGTGIVAYNPSDTPCDITITPYTAAGAALITTDVPIGSKGKYIGTVSSLGLPAGTAWLQIEATSPITGFELFARTKLLGGYTGVGITGTEGVFAKLEKDGATGIAFVNIENSSAVVTLTAYNDSGTVITTETIDLNAHEKVVDIPENIFTGDISNATYITYSSDKEVVGFQLNASSDGMMLDALPGM